MVATQPSALAVNRPGSASTPVAELVELVEAQSRQISILVRSATARCRHLAMEAIALKSGTQIVHVPYTRLALRR